MIDVHSHILPMVDDGARSHEEALTMLRAAVVQGVTIQVLTPHIHHGKFDNSQEQLTSEFIKFKSVVNEASIKIKLLLAAELHISDTLLDLALKDEIPIIGKVNGLKIFLLEFPRIELPLGYDNLVKWLLSKGYLPLIVHPERNQTFIKQPQKLEALYNLGCPLQITGSSILGHFGEEARDFAMKLLENDMVSAIASDCHNLKGRSPNLGEAWEVVDRVFSHKKLYSTISQKQELIINENPFL